MIIKLSGKIDTREVLLNGKPLNPEPSQAVINHSPDGFLWGYGGSGPAQLAAAVMLECCEDKDKAIKKHQHFKWKEIAALPDGDFDVEIDMTKYIT